MYKSIFMCFLFAFSYFAVSILPLKEVSAQTIAITSGNNQSTTRGSNFSNAVTFTVTNSGTPVSGESVSIGTDTNMDNVRISETATGTFGTELSLTTDTSGEVTFHVKANTDALYDTCFVGAVILVGTGTSQAAFNGTITDVLYFSADTATRSVTEGTAANTNIGAAVSATHWANADTDTTNDVTLAYSLEGTDAASFDIVSTTGQLKTSTALNRGTSYSVKVKVEEKDETTVRSDDTIDVAISVTQLPAPTHLTATASDSEVRLSWTAPSTTVTITGYEYSSDDGANWNPSGTGTTFVVMDLANGTSYTFRVRAVSGSIKGTATPPVEVNPETPRKRTVIYECPVGWQRTDRFARPNPRVLLYEVNLEMDLQNRVSIYKPTSVAIYVHPDEAFETLDGWKLKVAVPYNHHRDYLLTAENSVVVDANIEGIEGGFAFIENPEEDPFPMIGMGFTGALVPGFDYRLYDDTGRKVDFGIACYKRGGIFQALKDMEDPRVLRKVLLESLDWEAATYIRTEWTVPVPAPAAPSLVKKTVVGTWAALKKQ